MGFGPGHAYAHGQLDQYLGYYHAHSLRTDIRKHTQNALTHALPLNTLQHVYTRISKVYTLHSFIHEKKREEKTFM